MRKATEEWLASARDDLETIDELIDNRQLTHVVAFHTQQCVEKCLKALLEEREHDVPNIHNLITLLGRLEAESVEAMDEDLLERLNQLYIEARYPGERGLLPEGKPLIAEAERFQKFARSVYDRVHQDLQSKEK
jgi:HEPN domain-containing protein